MKRAKNSAKMMPDSSALEGIPNKQPHEDFAKKDANFKKQRAGTQT